MEIFFLQSAFSETKWVSYLFSLCSVCKQKNIILKAFVYNLNKYCERWAGEVGVSDGGDEGYGEWGKDELSWRVGRTQSR